MDDHALCFSEIHGVKNEKTAKKLKQGRCWLASSHYCDSLLMIKLTDTKDFMHCCSLTNLLSTTYQHFSKN